MARLKLSSALGLMAALLAPAAGCWHGGSVPPGRARRAAPRTDLTEPSGTRILGTPCRLVYVPRSSTLWVSAPARSLTREPSLWNLWRVAIGTRTAVRVASLPTGNWDVTTSQRRERVAWLSGGELHVLDAAGPGGEQEVERAYRDRASPLRWSPDGGGLVWLDIPAGPAEGALCVWAGKGSSVRRVLLPRFSEAGPETPPLWASGGKAAYVVCRGAEAGPYVLTWNAEGGPWRVWGRPLPDQPTPKDYHFAEGDLSF